MTNPSIDPELINSHLSLVIEGLQMHGIRRFFHQRFFEVETREAEYASRVESFPRLESVSEHSWHLADSIVVIGPTFEEVDVQKAVTLAIIHDKLEMFIGDVDPIGRDGTGNKAHAFSAEARTRKRQKEAEALDKYLARLPSETRRSHEDLFREVLRGNSLEARFVKSLDKLVAIAFVLVKKGGKYQDRHLRLIRNLVESNARIYPRLSPYHQALFKRLIVSTARFRQLSVDEVLTVLNVRQQQLPFHETESNE